MRTTWPWLPDGVRTGVADSPGDESGASVSDLGSAAAAKSMVAFRRRINAFFGHPRAAEFAATLDPPSPRPPTTAAAAMRVRLDQVLSRLRAVPTGERLRLRTSLTMHDGRVVRHDW